MRKYMYIICVALLGCLFLLGGCGEKTQTTEAPKATPVEMVKVAYYVPNDKATGVVKKEVELAKGQDTPEHALEALLKEQAQVQYSVFPKNLKVLKVKVDENHVALVEMNEALLHPVDTGSLTERLELASLVNTLTEFPSIHSVLFIVNGAPVTAISGHVDMRDPLKRMDSLIVDK